jgi:hypothetical protein
VAGEREAREMDFVGRPRGRPGDQQQDVPSRVVRRVETILKGVVALSCFVALWYLLAEVAAAVVVAAAAAVEVHAARWVRELR